jgi:hypothetical protein
MEVSGERLVKKAHPARSALGLENGKNWRYLTKKFERTWPPRLFPMNELAMDFPGKRLSESDG